MAIHQPCSRHFGSHQSDSKNEQIDDDTLKAVIVGAFAETAHGSLNHESQDGYQYAHQCYPYQKRSLAKPDPAANSRKPEHKGNQKRPGEKGKAVITQEAFYINAKDPVLQYVDYQKQQDQANCIFVRLSVREIRFDRLQKSNLRTMVNTRYIQDLTSNSCVDHSQNMKREKIVLLPFLD